MGGDLDPILHRQSIGEFLLAITPPNNSGDRDRLGKFQFNPAASAFVRDPTVAIPYFAVINVFEPVKLRIREDTRGPGFRSPAGEGDVLRLRPGGIDLQFV